LRERREDIPLLVDHFIRKFSEKMNRPYSRIEKGALAILSNFNWPGNVRQLENFIEGVLVVNSSGVISEEDIPERMKKEPINNDRALFELPEEGINLKNFENDLIKRALEKCDHNQSKTARYLGITRNTLLYRISKLN
jgi:two-component system NtrC family response regulator